MKVEMFKIAAILLVMAGSFSSIISCENNNNQLKPTEKQELGYLCQCNLSVAKTSSRRLVAPGNRWNIHFDLTGYVPFWIYEHTNVLTVEEATVVDGISYFNLMQTTDSVASKRVHAGFIREDVLTQKVYYRPVGKPERLLYDFSLNKGDCISYEYPWTYPGIDDFIKTDITAEEVTSILIGGEYRKQITVRVELDFREGGTSRHVWIEGIGATDDFFQEYAQYWLVGKCRPRLNCFFQNENLVYKNIPTNMTIDTNDNVIIIPREDCCFFWRHVLYENKK